MAEEPRVGHDGIELAISETGKTFRYAKLSIEHQLWSWLISQCCARDVVEEEIGKLGHDLDHSLVSNELLDVSSEVQDEEAGHF